MTWFQGKYDVQDYLLDFRKLKTFDKIPLGDVKLTAISSNANDDEIEYGCLTIHLHRFQPKYTIRGGKKIYRTPQIENLEKFVTEVQVNFHNNFSQNV